MQTFLKIDCLCFENCLFIFLMFQYNLIWAIVAVKLHEKNDVTKLLLKTLSDINADAYCEN